MTNIGNSSILILASAIFSFTHPTLTIVSFSLGVIGCIVSYSIQVNEKHQKAKEIENTTESIASIISSLAAGSRDRNNLH